MPHDPKALRAILEAAAPDIELTFRAMFGGILAYVAGRPVASLSDVGLALKAGGAEYAALLAVPGAAALRYEPDAPPSKSYVVVPDLVLADPAMLRAHLIRSIASLPVAKPKSPARR